MNGKKKERTIMQYRYAIFISCGGFGYMFILLPCPLWWNQLFTYLYHIAMKFVLFYIFSNCKINLYLNTNHKLTNNKCQRQRIVICALLKIKKRKRKWEKVYINFRKQSSACPMLDPINYKCTYSEWEAYTILINKTTKLNQIKAALFLVN